MAQLPSIAEFEQDGVCCIRNALSENWLQLLDSGVNEVIENPEPQCAVCDIPSTSGKFFNGFFQSIANKAIASFIHESPIKDYARSYAGSQKIRFFYDQLLAKSPSTGQRTPWHSDRDYFPLSGQQILSVWIPLDPVTQSTGAMSFIRGSHKQPAETYVADCPKKNSIDQDKGMYVLPDFEQYPDLYDIASWDMQPGDVLVFHIDILHGASGNSSHKQWRRALATRWLGDDVQVKENGPHILQKPEIAAFLSRHGKPWRGLLDDKLFPLM